jgi:CubicO group peptidase (beta-lactamase class C family)
MTTPTIRKCLSVLILMIFLFASGAACGSPVAPAAASQATIASEEIAGIIAQYRTEIPRVMQQEGIPGLAIAVVDDKNILWAEGFGTTDWDRRTPITTSTLFSIQSMSKSFTATAAMFAAQDGLVDLDEPITTYLPNFTVHSIFEEHPEQKMNLRILLSHTAGFQYEPSYGNNNDRPAVFSFEKHIASIADSWLLFPVGTRYSYSNEGIDLAGYILQVRSGIPFVQYVQQKVLDPLGMKNSTLDYLQVRATSTRSFGHGGDPLSLHPPVDLLIIPSGGVWTTAEDMARYLQFHINSGSLDGKRLLKADLAETMLTPPNPAALYADPAYALGVYSYNSGGARYVQHGGGGFGVTNYMAWYPDLKLGAVVLSNAITPRGYAVGLCENVLASIINNNIPLYHERDRSADPAAPAYPPDTDGAVLTDVALRNLVESKALPMDQAAQKRRNLTAGTYVLTSRSFPSDTFDIAYTNGTLTYTHQGGESKVNQSGILTEVQPGLFVTDLGNTFDLRGPVLMVDNFVVVKINQQTLPFKIAFYALCALLFLSALFAWPAGALFRLLKRKEARVSEAARKGSPWPVLVRPLAALAALISLFCLAIVALLPDLVYFPWPRPWADLLWWQSAIFRLPVAGLLLGAAVALLAGFLLRKRPSRWYYLAVGLAVLVCNGVILV